MTQAEYNAKVQEMQAMWPAEAHRIDTTRDREGFITCAYFQVSWDGAWQTVGGQRNPFRDDTTYFWYEDDAMRLQGQFAASVAHS